MWSPLGLDMGVGGYTIPSILGHSADPGRVGGVRGPHSSFIREDAQGPLAFVSLAVGWLLLFLVVFDGSRAVII